MTKPTIVVLHGWGLSKARFAPLVAALKRTKYPVIALDFPGFGEAAAPTQPFTLADYAEFLHQFLQKENIEMPILLGHSFGGRVALKFTSLYPTAARALILTGTPGYTPVARGKLAFFIALAKVGKAVFSLPLLSVIQDQLRRWYYYVVGAREFYRAEGSMRETFKNIVKEPLVTYMEHVAIPCLLVWGELDIITPLWIGEKMATTIPGATLVVIPEKDHGVPFKEPTVFTEAIMPFLTTV